MLFIVASRLWTRDPSIGVMGVLVKMKYGQGEVEFDVDGARVLKILEPNERPGLKEPLKGVQELLRNPIGTAPLADLISKERPKDVTIVVNDITRPTPYEYLLPPLLAELKYAGISDDDITFLTATGIHDPHTEEQNEQVYGKELVKRFRFVSHSADDEGSLVDLGELSTGFKLSVNKLAVRADFLITLGVIMPHYFAGFSGGRKSILPGVASRECIEKNHSRMLYLMDDLPPIEQNPISLEMIEAARKAGVDFILNVVTNSKKEITSVVAGDLEEAWYRGVAVSSAMYEVPIEQKVDVALVSAGGFPRDINVYQSQKALDHADKATKPGGTIILIAECRDGLGERVFEEWMKEAKTPDDVIGRIRDRFVLGGHKAYGICKVAKEKEIILISSLSDELTKRLFMRKMDTLRDAIDYVEAKYDSPSYILMPVGSLTVPIMSNK